MSVWWFALACTKGAPPVAAVVLSPVSVPCPSVVPVTIDEELWAAPLDLQRAAAARWARDPNQRLNLALLLVVGAPELRDETRALALLADPQGDVLFGVVQALVTERAEHRQAQEAAAAALASERAEREALEARLRAIKAIDREMDVRELGGPGDDEDPSR